MGDHLDPRGLIFPVTTPPPTNWADVQLVVNRVSRHWGLIRGLIDDQRKARRNRSSSSARLTATLFREVVTRLSLSLEAVDTKDKFSSVPGVGAMIRKVSDKHLVAQVTARNPKHQPSTKVFVAAPAAILVAMSREASRLAEEGDMTGADALWLTEGEIRALAAPLCEEDLSHRGDEIVLGEVENFGWGSMAHLLNEFKFGCVKSKDLDEKSTIAKLEKLGKRLVCTSPDCSAYATKSLGELSDRVKLDTFRRSVYCKEHYAEVVGGGGSKRKKAAGKGKGKGSTGSKACDHVVLDDLDLLPSLGNDLKSTGAAVEVFNPYSSAASSSSSNTAAPSGAGAGAGSGGGTGKIKASWYRRLLGEALLAVELDRVEATRGVGVSGGLTAPWRKEFAKNATCLYALTPNGQYVAKKLEIALRSSGASTGAETLAAAPTSKSTATATATASPILNRTSYASFSERDGGGGGGTAASRQTGHFPLAPARAHGAAKPGVRLLVDNREKRGATGNSQISELTSFLNSRRVPYEVREWKVGDYGWVVQPDAGNRPSAGEVGYEREFVVPRLLERKRVDDLAESMKDGRLVRQKKAMLRARDEGVVSEIEIHVEGGTQDRRFMDEIYRRGLTPDDLDAALQESEGHGFKVVHHRNFVEFGAYLADATTALQRRFDEGTLDYDNFFTWQNFVRFSKGQIPLTPTGAAAERAAAAAKAVRAGRRSRFAASAAGGGGGGGGGGGRGRPPLPVGSAAAVGSGLRQRTLDGAFGVAGRSRGPGGSGGGGGGGAQGGAGSHASGASAEVSKHTVEGSGNGGAKEVVNLDDDDDGDDDDCSIVELVGEAPRPGASGGRGGSGAAAAASSTLRDVGGNGGGRSSGSGGGGQGKRKAVAEAGSSPFTIAAAGGFSPAASAAKVRRAASPALSSLPKPATATASSRGLTPRDDDSYSPPPTGGAANAHGGGARSGCVGRNSSRGSKRSRPDDECSGGRGRVDLSVDRGSAPSSSGGGGGGGGGRASADGVRAKARSLSFADDDIEEEDKNRKSGTGAGGCGGGRGSGMSSVRRDKASLSASSCPADAAGVVDLSADSPSPPPPPRSRQQQSAQHRHRKESGNGGGGGSRGGAGSMVVLEACSSDDDFTL